MSENRMDEIPILEERGVLPLKTVEFEERGGEHYHVLDNHEVIALLSYSHSEEEDKDILVINFKPMSLEEDQGRESINIEQLQLIFSTAEENFPDIDRLIIKCKTSEVEKTDSIIVEHFTKSELVKKFNTVSILGSDVSYNVKIERGEVILFDKRELGFYSIVIAA